jgi:hypothetical protein
MIGPAPEPANVSPASGSENILTRPDQAQTQRSPLSEGRPWRQFLRVHMRAALNAVWKTAAFTARRIRASLTAERITAAFTVVLALATLALVVTAYFQHMDAVVAIEETKKQHTDAVAAIKETERLATATEKTATERWQISSAELVLKFLNIVEDSDILN